MVDRLHGSVHFVDQRNDNSILEVDVADISLCCSNDSLVVTLVHLEGSDSSICMLKLRVVVWVLRWTDLSMDDGVFVQNSLRTSHNNLSRVH